MCQLCYISVLFNCMVVVPWPRSTQLLQFCYVCQYCSYTFVQYTVSKNVLSATVSGTVSWILREKV